MQAAHAPGASEHPGLPASLPASLWVTAPWSWLEMTSLLPPPHPWALPSGWQQVKSIFPLLIHLTLRPYGVSGILTRRGEGKAKARSPRLPFVSVPQGLLLPNFL